MSMFGPRKPVSKIGVPPGQGATDRTKASSPPTSTPDTTTDAFTYFTQASNDTQVLYTADRAWVRITLFLETAGPVAVGTKSSLQPVLAGTGVLLPTGQAFSMYLAKGNKLYVASTSVNRVKVVVEPLPWLQSILNSILSLVK